MIISSHKNRLIVFCFTHPYSLLPLYHGHAQCVSPSQFFNAAGTSLIGQGFAAPEDLEQLRFKEIVRLCKGLRLPGGLIPNPVAIPGADGVVPPGVPLFVANPGETVGE